MLVTVDVRSAKSAGGTSGPGAWSIRTTNATPAATASAPAARIAGSVQPRDEPSVRAQVLAASAAAASAAPAMSRWGAASGSRDSGIAARVHTTTATATGTFTKNAHRQPGPSTRKPPTKGPSAPAI